MECVHISSDDWVWYVCDVLYTVLYVRMRCFVVAGCAVSRSYINVYHDHLRFRVVYIDGRMYVCCSECNVISNECNEPTSCIVQPIGTHGGEVIYFGCVCFRGELGFLNCDDICMCVVNKQFELLEFVFESVMLPCSMMRFFSLLLLCLCPCSHVVIFGLSVRLLWYPMWMRWLI